MRRRFVKGLIPVCLLLAAVALAGCTNPDAPSTVQGSTQAASPQNPGEPPAPAPPTPAAQAPAAVQPTPAKALAAFSQLYTNWTYHTLSSNQRTLAAMSVGAARLAEQQAAASSRADTTITRGHIYNHGQILSIAPDLAKPQTWVIVTREQTAGNTQYEGLPATYHVTLAQLVSVPGGYAIELWLPQN
jgi:pyruvate/2-oxoglutarate dehydrogenase complex dihydrolipoamide acyltransferase (E2) component